MKEKIELTRQEANELLAILQEIPIRHLPIVSCVNRFFDERFKVEANEEAESTNP